MLITNIRIPAAERQPKGRVSADDLLLFLDAERRRTGDSRLTASKSTLRTWKHRGHLSPGRGYDVAEVVDYLTSRGDHGQHRTRSAELTLIK